jgi:PIN domain nuclease of toxin-antitoxin system
MRLLLDTHILWYWLMEPDKLSPAQSEALAGIDPKNPAWISEITLWEIATLYSLGRLELDLRLEDWLERASAPPLVRRQGITPEIAAEVASLPDDFHRDPADRLLVATARVLEATLVTQDRRILSAGVASVLA